MDSDSPTLAQMAATPYKLWSLWDMVFKNARQLVRTLRMVDWTYTCIVYSAMTHAGGRLDNQKVISTDPVGKKDLVKLRTLCKQLGLTITAEHVHDLLQVIDAKWYSHKTYGEQCRAMLGLFESELKDRQFMFLEPGRSRYFTNPLREFGDDAARKLPDCRFDMIEAGKCFALERPTACVFHLYRVVEGALRTLAVAVGVNPKTPTKSKLWQPLADEIRAAVSASKPSTQAESRIKTARLLALDRFENVRDTRNASAHPDDQYTDEEARETFTHIVAFIKQLVKAL